MEAAVDERREHPDADLGDGPPLEIRMRSIPQDKRPFAEHAQELGVLDWWAIALWLGEHVTIEFDVPEENLRIIMTGHPHQYGPAVLEVRKPDGTVVRRFEQPQVSVEELTDEAE